MTLYVANNYQRLQRDGSSIVLYLPKIQTAEEAALWNEMLLAAGRPSRSRRGTIKVYVLVEQLEATFQLMEIRAALAEHFVGFNTGRWDYINSVADALAWKMDFINPNIDAITMSYGYMRNYEDRVRRAVNTPDSKGTAQLGKAAWSRISRLDPRKAWPTACGRPSSGRNASSGKGPAASGWPTGKWFISCDRSGRTRGRTTSWGVTFPPTDVHPGGRRRLNALGERAANDPRCARPASVGLQYGNAFGQGFQAAALQTGGLLRQRRRPCTSWRTRRRAKFDSASSGNGSIRARR